MLISDIKVEQRARTDSGDIESLARSMRKLGQLQPIGVDADGTLIFGGRRLQAARSLGWTEIEARVVDCDALQAEHDENEIRKQFTVSERLAIAQRVAGLLGGRVGNPELRANCGNISTIGEAGQKTRDIAAAKAGLGSGKTLEAAQKVVERDIPELVEAMDQGKVTIHAAKNIATLRDEEVLAINFDDKEEIRKARHKGITREKRGADPAYGTRRDLGGSRSAPVREKRGKPAETLASLAVQAIQQISVEDPAALESAESIRAALDHLLALLLEAA